MSDAAVTYRVRLDDPGAHRILVRCELNAVAGQVLRMASWIPGSYLLREYARHVVNIEACSAQGSVAVTKLDKGCWRCANEPGQLSVTLTVYAFDLSVRGAYFDQRRAFFNGTCLFPEFLDVDPGPLDVLLDPPSGSLGKSWRVATAMTRASVDERGFGRYQTLDYEELLDHPFEISDFITIDFVAGGVPHHFVLAGRQDGGLERLAADLQQICETQIAFFGRPAPMQAYWFLGLALGEGYGGLEHRASSSLIFSREDLPRAGDDAVSTGYRRFLGLVSHEYFHTWNVKRMKPAAFSPYRLDRRNYTRLLWVFEGITTYYQDLLVLRSDLLPVAGYLERLAQTLTRVYRVPGRRNQSLAQASFEAWDQLYKPTENSANAGISYYTKGALVALALDLTLRLQTAGRTSLDDVMRGLWQRYGQSSAGVEEDGFEALVAEISGLDLSDFFASTVRGTEDPELATLLKDFGVLFELRARLGPSDEGGPAADAKAPSVALGVQLSRQNPNQLAAVLAGGAAEQAGLAAGDQLVALDDLKLTGGNLAARLAHYAPGETVRLLVFRGDELLSFSVELQAPWLDTVSLVLADSVSGATLARRQAWLGA